MIVNSLIPPGCGTGLIKRNYKRFPSGYQTGTTTFPSNLLVDPSEYEDRLNENRKNKAGLLDRRQGNIEVLKSLNQGQFGLCWSFSTTKAVMYLREIMGFREGPRLAGWWLAGLVKNWRDQGGWGAASLEKATQVGVATEEDCPSYNRKYDTPEVRANAAQNLVTEWWDGVDDPNTNQKIAISMLLQSTPCVVDLNVMGHSMCCIDIKSLNPLELIYDNSWGTNGDKDGLYYGKGAYARPDGLVIPRVSLPSTL